MSYRVRTDNFEGPFDILLYLVSRQRVDIGSIAIAEIADQYLEEVAQMQIVDLDVASDFLLVASTLLEIKAASLVPRDNDDADDDIADLAPSEARDILVARLLEYKKYKNATSMLEARAQTQARMHARPFGPDIEYTQVMPDFLRDVTLEGIALIAASTYARRDIELLDSEHIAAKPIPVEEHVKGLYRRLKKYGHARFSELVGAKTPTPIVVVTFLALLELFKRSMVDIVQEDQFGDISITYTGEGELLLDEDVDEADGADAGNVFDEEPAEGETAEA